MKVCLDSRLINQGDFFVPVKGETFDGHQFIEQALKKGASGVIEEEELYKLASEKLKKIKPLVIAITGSVGKSTTREFIIKILSQKFEICDGYLNTKLGLATNIINEMSDTCQIFVAECGMDKKGELGQTGAFIEPDIVFLTHISESHIEKLGSIQAIKDAKSELIKSVKEGGIGFFNWSNPDVIDIACKFPPRYIVPYGIKPNSFFEKLSDADNIAKDFGEHNLINLDGAILLAKHLGIEDAKILEAIKKLKTPKGRLSRFQGIKGSIIFDDTYNASPASTLAGLKFVSEFYENNKPQGRKIAVLGGMLELGNFEDEGHTKVGDGVGEQRFEVLLVVGELAQKILMSKSLKNTQIFQAQDVEQAVEILKNEVAIAEGDVLLVKGSQGIRMEKVVEGILLNPDQDKKNLVRQDERWS
jgi:UDP-N-acetylmuramoyl-tripeptide--D-alanyl-D-alanine ligase